MNQYNQYQSQSSSFQQQSKQSIQKFYPPSPLAKHTHAAINICQFRKLKRKQEKQIENSFKPKNQNNINSTRHASESRLINGKIIDFVSCKLRVLNQLATLNNPNDLLAVANSSEFQQQVINSKKLVQELDKAAKVFLQAGYTQKKEVSINQILKFLEKFSTLQTKINFISNRSSSTQIQSPRIRIKDFKNQQLSTNHVSKVNSNNVTKRSRNQPKTNAISSWNQYEVGQQVEDYHHSNNQSTYHNMEGASQLNQKQDRIQNTDDDQNRRNQNTFENDNKQVVSESKEILQQYFFHFIISLASSKSHYKQFLNKLLDEIQFDQNDSQSQRKAIQKKMRIDVDYSLKMLSTILKNKIDRQGTNDTQPQFRSTAGSLSTNKLFLQLCRQFLDINVQQLSKAIKNFQSKYASVREILLKVQKIDSCQVQTKDRLPFKLTDTLTKYLPAEQMPLNQFTFSPRSINKLNFNIDQHGKMLQNKHFMASALNILKKNILKITFNRIRFCQRYNFDAVLRISDIIINSSLLQQNLNSGLVEIRQYVEQLEYRQAFEAKIFEVALKNNLKRVFKAWKSIKSIKLKLLRQLLRKKERKLQKQKLFMFSHWRVNVSRLGLGQKIMAHSQSCSSVIDKFSNSYSLDKKVARNPTNQFNAEQAKQMTPRKSSANKAMHNKHSKSSNNLKASFAIQNYSRTRKGLNYNTKEPIKPKPNLKLLSYQYKEKIQDRLNYKDTTLITGQKKLPLKRYSKLPIQQSGVISKQNNRLKEMKNTTILSKH